MLYSKLFPKTLREAPKDAVSVNHQLLVRAGFVDQLMAGSWTLLPLGWKVVTKIENVIREELAKIGCLEMLMPLMHPKEIWNETGRWDSADEVMYKVQDTNSKKQYALSFTHEEIVMDLLRKHIQSYKDLPVAIYHFSTKFRNEARPQGGVLRGREFLMKDLYSAHESEEDMMKFYEQVSEAYIRIFERFGFEVYITEAAGGVFTQRHTREFQVVTGAGEDTIYVKPGTRVAVNKEVFTESESDYEIKRAVEVGNIFPFGSEKYAEMMGGTFTGKDGKKVPVHFASYGIGVTRLMGVMVEVGNDKNGIIWPKEAAPFDAHLIVLSTKDEGVYEKLMGLGVDVLWDDTDRGVGQKFADADLIGCPVRLVVSEKNNGLIEWKERDSDKIELISLNEVIKKIGR